MKKWILVISAILLWTAAGSGPASADGTDGTGQEENLRQAGARLAAQENNGSIFKQGETNDYIAAVARRIWAQTPSDRTPATFKIIQNAIPNAYTYPDGTIYISTGMLVNIQNEDQLAMIMAHEIIHYLRRHALSALAQIQGKGFAQPNQTALAEVGYDSEFSVMAFCEAAERQADAEGLELMQRAGYCPREVIPLLTALDGAALGEPLSKRWFAFDLLDRNRSRSIRIEKLLAFGPEEISACRASDGSRQTYAQRTAPAFLANAEAAIQKGYWEQGIKSIERYSALRPNDPYSCYLLGKIQVRRKGPVHAALQYYQEAIALDPAFVPAYREMGFIYFKSGQLAQARRFFETSLTLSPQAAENVYIKEYLRLCLN